eukprot:8884479-Karenia_brevis.AAC.1
MTWQAAKSDCLNAPPTTHKHLIHQHSRLHLRCHWIDTFGPTVDASRCCCVPGSPRAHLPQVNGPGLR